MSMLKRVRRPLVGAAMTIALVIGSFIAAAPAQAASAGPDVVPWSVAKTTAAPAPSGRSVQALCQTPTRYTNAVTWNCTVFGGQFIEAWMTCSGTTYYSGLIPEGSWWIVGICPAGTWRDDEGIIYY
jgi:hypothetical protein